MPPGQAGNTVEPCAGLAHNARAMNAAHVHLISSHAPVFAVAFGLFLWLVGVMRRSVDFRRAAFILFVAAGLLSGPAYWSGRPALRALEPTSGWDPRVARQHEEVAALALGGAVGLGLAALVALFRLGKVPHLPRGLSGLVLGLALLSGAVLCWTSGLGGRVRHPEIVSPAR